LRKKTGGEQKTKGRVCLRGEKLEQNKKKGNQGGDFLGRGKDKKRGEKFFREKREACCRNGEEKEKK